MISNSEIDEKLSHTCPKSQFVRGEGTKYKLFYTVKKFVQQFEKNYII